jgi:hypothetical protein
VKEEQEAHFFLKGTKSSIIFVGTLAISSIYGIISSSSCRCYSFVVTLASAFSSQILLHKSKIKVLRNFPYGGSCYLKNPQSKSGYKKTNYHKYNRILDLYCEKRMNKKEIELHYLPYSICGPDVLGFHHSMKSTEVSSSRSDTKVVAGMRRGGS